MKIVSGGRRSGKTTKLMQWFEEDPENRGIITYSNIAADVYRVRYPQYKDHFFSFRSSNQLRGRKLNFAIDELEGFLRDQLGFTPDIVSMGPIQLEMLQQTDPQQVGGTANAYL